MLIKLAVILLFSACWGLIVILFGHNASIGQVIVKTVVPVVLVGGLYFAYTWYQNRKKAALEKASAQMPTAAPTEVPIVKAIEPKMVALQVYGAAAHCGVEPDEVGKAITEYVAPELDSELVNFAGIALPVRRVWAVDDWLEMYGINQQADAQDDYDDIEDLNEFDEDAALDDAQPSETPFELNTVPVYTQRTFALIALTLQELEEILNAIAEQFVQVKQLQTKMVTSASLSSPELFEQNQQQTLTRNLPQDLAVYHSVPALLQVYVELHSSQQLYSSWFSAQVNALLAEYGLTEEHVQLKLNFVEQLSNAKSDQAQAQKNVIKMLNTLAEPKLSQIALFIAATSNLDQDWIDEQLVEMEGGRTATMCEYSTGIILANLPTQMVEWQALQHLELYTWQFNAHSESDQTVLTSQQREKQLEQQLQDVSQWMTQLAEPWAEPLVLFSDSEPFEPTQSIALHVFADDLTNKTAKKSLLKQSGYVTENAGLFLPWLTLAHSLLMQQQAIAVETDALSSNNDDSNDGEQNELKGVMGLLQPQNTQQIHGWVVKQHEPVASRIA